MPASNLSIWSRISADLIWVSDWLLLHLGGGWWPCHVAFYCTGIVSWVKNGEHCNIVTSPNERSQNCPLNASNIILLIAEWGWSASSVSGASPLGAWPYAWHGCFQHLLPSTGHQDRHSNGGETGEPWKSENSLQKQVRKAYYFPQISFCRNSISEQEKVIEAVREEIEMMARLNHPNIVRILGATQQGCHFFMFVEWMPGRSFWSLVKPCLIVLYNDDHCWQVALWLSFWTSMAPSQSLSWLATSCRCSGVLPTCMKTTCFTVISKVGCGALSIHLPEKIISIVFLIPGANLLVDSTGQRIRIGDFGASARLASRNTGAGEFQGQLLGTIAFMAPEVRPHLSWFFLFDLKSKPCCSYRAGAAWGELRQELWHLGGRVCDYRDGHDEASMGGQRHLQPLSANLQDCFLRASASDSRIPHPAIERSHPTLPGSQSRRAPSGYQPSQTPSLLHAQVKHQQLQPPSVFIQKRGSFSNMEWKVHKWSLVISNITSLSKPTCLTNRLASYCLLCLLMHLLLTRILCKPLRAF